MGNVTVVNHDLEGGPIEFRVNQLGRWHTISPGDSAKIECPGVFTGYARRGPDTTFRLAMDPNGRYFVVCEDGALRIADSKLRFRPNPWREEEAASSYRLSSGDLPVRPKVWYENPKVRVLADLERRNWNLEKKEE